MKREVWAAAVLGLLLLAYVLEAVVNPLPIDLSTPYSFFQGQYLTHYPFTSTIVLIRAIAVFLIPLLVASLFQRAYFAKAVSILILSGLLQLYALQDIAVNTATISLEWALALALAGLMLLLPVLYYFLRGLTDSTKRTVKKAAVQTTGDTTTPNWLDDEL